MAPDIRRPTVVVTGDLVVDVNLTHSPVSLSYYAQALPVSALGLRAGGAWFLKDVVAMACEGTQVIGPEPPVHLCADSSGKYAQSLQVWRQVPKVAGKPEDVVWRIAEFLGCERPDCGQDHPNVPDDLEGRVVLVVDDLGLGFTATEKWWPRILKEGDGPAAVVVKATSLPDHSAFWQRLQALESDVTVVLSVETLREAGARIAAPLSWDQAVEEIQEEFTNGLAHERLARFRRVVIRYGVEGAASFTRRRLGDPGGPKPLGDMRFERFVYQPDALPGDARGKAPAITFGATSALTAAVVRHEVGRCSEPSVNDYPVFIALGRGLRAARVGHQLGGGEEAKGTEPDAALGEMARILTWSETKKKDDDEKEPAGDFCSAFDHEVLDDPDSRGTPGKSDLLGDASGRKRDYLMAKAVEVVLRGAEAALAAAPRAKYGKYVTTDREEIERINAIRYLIEGYLRNDSDTRPLSIAVFGPPGAGKSTAIKNLAAELFPQGQAKLEFNLAQMSDTSLGPAFQLVRDASIRKVFPLVFWDEFDSDGLKWLKHFLAPMQDAEFSHEGTMHPLGKCIMIFAGGTCQTFEDFRAKAFSDPGGKQEEGPCQRKAPDFVSRLRGHLNVKGPNPIAETQCPPPPDDPEGVRKDFDERAKNDPQYLIRRAIILRSSILEYFPQLMDQRTKQVAISVSLARAFLEAGDLAHGGRSLNAMVAMSTVGTALYYNATQLPAKDFVEMHAPDLPKRPYWPELEPPVIEELARACHTYWLVDKVLAAKLDDSAADEAEKEMTRAKLLALPYRELRDQVDGGRLTRWCWSGDRLQKPYDQLTEDGKEGNRRTARETSAKLAAAGCRVVRQEQADGGSRLEDCQPILDLLALAEHDSWLRGYLLAGFEFASETNKQLRLHVDVVPFDKVPEAHQNFDHAIVRSIPAALAEQGYAVIAPA